MRQHHCNSGVLCVSRNFAVVLHTSQPSSMIYIFAVCFCRRIQKLISVMTSRYAAEALKPHSPDSATLVDFLDYLTRWEACKGGFVSESTATGLRVTIMSVLSLLQYLTQTIGFKYMMTSRLSTDPLENLFGIVRQSSGCNAHPSPEQFLITVNRLSFYNLARSVDRANAEPDIVSALISVDDLEGPHPGPKRIDDMLPKGNWRKQKYH